MLADDRSEFNATDPLNSPRLSADPEVAVRTNVAVSFGCKLRPFFDACWVDVENDEMLNRGSLGRRNFKPVAGTSPSLVIAN